MWSELDEVLKGELERLKESRLFRFLRRIDSPQAPEVVLDGKKVILMCSNNYLGLANHPEVVNAAVESMKRYGYGAVASRLVSGNMKIHEEFEEHIAAFKGAEAALLFNCGYMANIGVLSALCDSARDLIVSDKLNHASIIDGVMLSKAKFAFFRHNDPEHLEAILNAKRAKARRVLIVVDGVFSMDGDIAPLKDIVSLAERYEAMVMVDDAHATGVIGRTGRGSVEHWELYGRIDVQMGTLGKALGGFGAFVCGSRALIDYLINRCRPFIYTTALPVPVVAAARRAVELLEAHPEMVERLRSNVNYFVSSLKDMGFNVSSSKTAIIPVIIGDEEAALKMSELLLERGVFVAAMRPPTVPRGTSRLRVTLMATHTKNHLDRALEAFRDAAKLIGII
ncbi:MAG: 8-amino-7-oxononanoate synthase [Deferribacteres bacterium]|nr:8-amino-7-oxononanoate synthase [Deferribacteres bacterium]